MSNKKPETVIVVEAREPANILAMITELGYPTIVGGFDAGDIVIGDVLIERKEMGDFMSSLTQGRLFDQLFKMKTTGLKCILAVIGEIPKYDYYTKKKMTQEKYVYYINALKGMQLVSFLSYGVDMMQFKTYTEFLDLIKRVYDRSDKESLKPVVKKSTSLKDIKSDILSCIPGIGRKMSDELSLNMTVKELSNMSILDMSKLTVCGRHLGEIRAKNIYTTLNE